MKAPPLITGSDVDEFGCNTSAGYSYCNYTDSCIRPWETNCAGNSNSHATITTGTISQTNSSFSASGSIEFRLATAISSQTDIGELITFSLVTLDGNIVATKSCTCQNVTFSEIPPGNYTVTYNVSSRHASMENQYQTGVVVVTSGHSTTVATEIIPKNSTTVTFEESFASSVPQKLTEKGPGIERLTKSPTASPSPMKTFANTVRL